MYSLDGTRSIQILSERREAYLYDLTAKDPNSADARGRWLGTGVKSAKFVYDDKHEADGSTTQVLRQIELTFDNPKVKASVDLEGERKVVVAGDDRVAYLYDLKNEDVEEKFLASRVSEIKLVNSESTDASGNVTRKLKLVLVTAEDSEGVDSLFLFNRDGGPYESAPAAEVPEEVAPGAIPEAPSVPDAPTAPDAPRASAAERMHQSAAFQTLMSGQLGW
ncbi:MAG: hypothetical protein HYZ74_03300 [Elusimicrobia bacterium]|nr:hypothetical protein [Elusimicrobiota bacterium]